MKPQFFNRKKEIKIEHLKKRKSHKVSVVLATVILFFILSGYGAYAVSQWFDTHRIVFNQPVKMKIVSPIEIKERKAQIIEKKIGQAKPEEVNTPIKEYACKKWGEFNCLTMIAVFQSESGWDNTKWHYNENKSLDYGLGQINSINWKLEGCSLKEIVDEYKNINCAYKIWDRADGKEGNNKGSFDPWVVYQTQAYLANL